MPIPIDDIERRFEIRNGAPLPPELRALAIELGTALESVAAVCDELEVRAATEARYQAALAKLGPLTASEEKLLRDELAKGKPISMAVAIVEQARQRPLDAAASPPGEPKADDDDPSP